MNLKGKNAVDRHLNIAMILDEGYVLPTVVAAYSLVKNKKAESIYDIYLVLRKVSDESKALFKKLEDKKNGVTFHFVDVADDYITKKFPDIRDKSSSANTTDLIKFFLPEILEDVDKVFYFDGDTIVRDDLTGLLDTELDDKTYAAATRDTGGVYTTDVSLEGKREYINCGVMYLNLDLLRTDNMPEKLLQDRLNDPDTTHMDQNVHNRVFAGHVKYISHAYNIMYPSLIRAHFLHHLTIERLNAFVEAAYRDWDDMAASAKIIHFATHDKPWKFVDSIGVEMWEEYYNESPVAGRLKERRKLNSKKILALGKSPMTRLLGLVIWELKTRGAKKTLLSKDFMLMKRNLKIKK